MTPQAQVRAWNTTHPVRTCVRFTDRNGNSRIGFTDCGAWKRVTNGEEEAVVGIKGVLDAVRLDDVEAITEEVAVG